MSDAAYAPFVLDRYTTIGELTHAFRRTLRTANVWIIVTLAATTGYLSFSGKTGVSTFGLIAVGTAIVLVTWRGRGIGVPLLPMLAMQHLITYGMPVLIQHRDVMMADPGQLLRAGLDVFAFLVSLTGSWWMAMSAMHPARPFAYSLQSIDREGLPGLSRIGFALAGGATLYMLLQSLDLTHFIFGLLPGGSFAIVAATVSMSSACGFFLMSMIIGTGSAPAWQRGAFWSLLTLNCTISAAGFLLSGAAISLSAALIGVFWSTGRIPGRFLIVTLTVLSFLNLGKFTMRERYWSREDDERVERSFGLLEMPAIYLEWATVSYDTLVGNDEEDDAGASFVATEKKDTQSLAERFNNLQNLLYVIEAMEDGNVPPLSGATYTLIPPLLVPRILWPGKPRTHEGQVLLNTHFGRQDLAGTFQTYIAWGLIAEAHGNFGAITGAIFLGVALGLFCAWMENSTAPKTVLSAEGFLSFAVFLGLANSFEMVSSVMVTSIFQSTLLIAGACLPFVRRQPVSGRPAS